MTDFFAFAPTQGAVILSIFACYYLFSCLRVNTLNYNLAGFSINLFVIMDSFVGDRKKQKKEDFQRAYSDGEDWQI